jgi:hypothetical protein
MGRTLVAALRLCRRRAGLLAGVALAVVFPVVVAVTALDFLSWREVDPGTPGAGTRELGDDERTVDVRLIRLVTVVQYALGALAYLVIVVLSLRALGLAGALGRIRSAVTRRPRRALAALGAGLAVVAAARVALSLSAAALLAPLGGSDPAAYLVAINAVHGLGKVLTGPYLAAVAAVVADPPGSGPGR